MAAAGETPFRLARDRHCRGAATKSGREFGYRFAAWRQHRHARVIVVDDLTLRRLLHQDFALILLDVQMPDMHGVDTAAMIRDRERSGRIPIIFLTGAFKTRDMMFEYLQQRRQP